MKYELIKKITDYHRREHCDEQIIQQLLLLLHRHTNVDKTPSRCSICRYLLWSQAPTLPYTNFNMARLGTILEISVYVLFVK